MNISYIISICTSIFFLRFWIIFTIIMLYYFPCRLPIPFSFCCSEFFPCSFVCNIFLCSLVLSNFLHFCPSFHRLQDHSFPWFWYLPPCKWGWSKILAQASLWEVLVAAHQWVKLDPVPLVDRALSRGVFSGSCGLRKTLSGLYQGNISCKDGLDNGQKWYGPNRSRRY